MTVRRRGVPSIPDGRVAIAVVRIDRTGSLIAAIRSSDSQPVALRLLAAPLHSDPAYINRLRRDVSRLTDQPHPTVVGVHGLLNSATGVAVETELADGVRLDELLAAAPLRPEAGLVVLYDLLDALAWLHHLGVLHLNVHPGAVVVDRHGCVRLGDVGIVLPTFKPRAAPGTPPYMAPELWNDAAPTRATDIYAATATAFEALTGAPPFRAARLMALRAAHLRAPIPLSRAPDAARLLMADGLAKDPANRSTNAAAFRDSVARLASIGLGRQWERRGREQLCELVSRNRLVTPSGQVAAPRQRVARVRRDRRVGIIIAGAVVGIALAASLWAGGNGAAVDVGSPGRPGSAASPSAPPPSTPARSTPSVTPSAVATLAASPRPTANRPVIVITPPPTPAPTPTPTSNPLPTPTPTPPST